MRYVRIFFKPEPLLPEDIVVILLDNYVDRENPDKPRILAVDHGSFLDMKSCNAIRYGFYESDAIYDYKPYYLENELKTDEDFDEFYRIFEEEHGKEVVDHHNEEIEKTLSKLD